MSVGIASAEYNNHIVQRFTSGVSAYSATGGAPSVASGRLSYTFGFKGPAMSIDTACSSSLVAAHVSVGAIWSNISVAAVAAGVGLLLNPEPTSMFHKAGMLAPDGRCKTLDISADGYVRGEAAGVLYFCDLVRSPASVDVLAYLIGSAVNQDGRSSSLTAPNGPSQQEVLRTALGFSKRNPDEITHLQMHGTGTPLGDPIELGAADAVLVNRTLRAAPVAASTAKGWIGHTEAAAGVMGIIHASVGTSNAVSQGISHLKSVNTHIMPILDAQISAGKQSFKWHLPRLSSAAISTGQILAGVSSFAFQGTNAHTTLQRADKASIDSSQLDIWNNQRIWIVPNIYSMANKAILNAGKVKQVDIECKLTSPRLSILRQHKIKEANLLPASAFLEISSCSFAILCALTDIKHCAINNSVFAIPAVLGNNMRAQRIVCNLNTATGFVEVSTIGSQTSQCLQAQKRRHFYASIYGPLLPGENCSNFDFGGKLIPKSKLLVMKKQEVSPCAIGTVQACENDDDGFICNPAVIEAPIHLNPAHPSYHHKQLRVAAKIQAVIYHSFSENRKLWVLSRLGEGGRLNSHHWTNNLGGKSVSGLNNVETRRLITERPQIQHPRYSKLQIYSFFLNILHCNHVQKLTEIHPFCLNCRTPRSPGAIPLTPRSPHTPIYLFGNNAALEISSPYGGQDSIHIFESQASSGAEIPVDITSLEAIVVDAVEGVIGDKIPNDQPLMEAGIDSLGATELQQKIADTLGIDLPSTLVFDYPTVDAMVQFLLEKTSKGNENIVASPALTSVFNVGFDSGNNGIAIVAATGHTKNLQNWKPGDGDATSLVPLDRWDVNHLIALNSTSDIAPQFGAFMDKVEEFDLSLFNIMRSEATSMDPQQRLLLQTTHEALESTSTGVSSALGRHVGTFIGIAATDYESLSHRNGVAISAFSFTSAAPSVVSGRLAYIFGMKGPAVSIDTACSASLVAAHMAYEGFRESPMEMAIVGGVLLCLVPESTLMLFQAQMLSPEGRSKTLDATADGYVRGEACRTIVLKSMNHIQPKDIIISLIRGSSVNTNGRSSSLTAPHGPSQQSLIRQAWSLARIRPSEVSGLQMHSNGTSLGDPIEVGAISAVALEGKARSFPFLMATVKGYTGHQEAAAGIVGLMEASQLLQVSSTAPALHISNLNPHVSSVISRQAASIARGGPYGLPSTQSDRCLLVGVSSFGAQGTNAHALMSGSNTETVLQEPTNENEARKISQKTRCWILKFDALLMSTWVQRRSQGSSGSVTFETNLSAPHLSWLWDYDVNKRPHLPSSSVLSSLAGIDRVMNLENRQIVGLQSIAMPAPLALPRLSRRNRNSNTVMSIKLKPSAGQVEVIFYQQKILTGKLSGMEYVNRLSQVKTVTSLHAASILGNLSLHGKNRMQRNADSKCYCTIVHQKSTAKIRASFSLHPTIIESVVQQSTLSVEMHYSPITWIRSVGLLIVPYQEAKEIDSLSANVHAQENWLISSAYSASPVNNGGSAPLVLQNLVLGEHDLPPSSPGPMSLSLQIEEQNGSSSPKEEDKGVVAMDNPLLVMSEEERILHLQAQIMGEVRNVVGKPIHPAEPLMTSGLDSRGGMELRRSLADSLGMQLPVTLLYDYQSIDDIVGFINSSILEVANKGKHDASSEISSSVDDEYDLSDGRTSRVAGKPSATSSVSKLLKTLRPPETPKPLFLAAPGVANAQSAYFAFSQYLQWSSQPIYVLDKDNDLNLHDLAMQNANDIIAIQAEGPYLIGGHSYGGAVAVEIAMVLESWGKEVGLVMVS